MYKFPETDRHIIAGQMDHWKNQEGIYQKLLQLSENEKNVDTVKEILREMVVAIIIYIKRTSDQ